MLKELIKRHREKKLEKKKNKPDYTIGDLYFGNIVLCNDKQHLPLFVVEYSYDLIKPFAMFSKTKNDKQYYHFKSKQSLYDITSTRANIGEYSVCKVDKFDKIFTVFMQENNITSKSKITENQIIQFENKINELFNDHNKTNDAIFM